MFEVPVQHSISVGAMATLISARPDRLPGTCRISIRVAFATSHSCCTLLSNHHVLTLVHMLALTSYFAVIQSAEDANCRAYSDHVIGTMHARPSKDALCSCSMCCPAAANILAREVVKDVQLVPFDAERCFAWDLTWTRMRGPVVSSTCSVYHLSQRWSES